MNTTEPHKKIVVVSGGFGYVGLEIIKQLSSNNFSLAILYNNTPQEKVDTYMRSLSGDGHKAYQCNLSDRFAVDSVFSKIENEQGKIFVCIHAAGRKPERKKLYLTTNEELENHLKDNVVSSFNFLTCSAKILQGHKEGVIIGITTAGVIVPEATKSLGTYIPAKFAVQGMLTMLKDELSPFGVKVYSIAPGFMSGGMNSDIPQAFVQMIQAKSNSKEIMNATKLAQVVASLSSGEQASDSLTVVLAPEYDRS
jgi:NAD(P)-dependent dehydrogenase (short-subunit alcohol dehydrogenase family)